jgi:hypothetical protein
MQNKKIVEVFWTPPDDVIAMTHGGKIPMDIVPPGIQSLAGTPIAHQLLLTAKVRDSAGTIIGMMSEIEIFSNDDAFEVYLTLVLPGRGALASYQTKSHKTLMEPFEKVLRTTDKWTGEMTVVMTTGPEAGDRGRLIAATGEFAGMSGFHQQDMTFHTITRSGSMGRVRERFVLSD